MLPVARHSSQIFFGSAGEFVEIQISSGHAQHTARRDPVTSGQPETRRQIT
jgi:hypothetical protein